MQREEHNQWETMERFNQLLNKEMKMDYLQAKQEVNASLDSPVFFLPGVVVGAVKNSV